MLRETELGSVSLRNEICDIPIFDGVLLRMNEYNTDSCVVLQKKSNSANFLLERDEFAFIGTK